MLNEYAYARALATEGAAMGLPQPYQTAPANRINADGKLVISAKRLVHSSDKLQPITYAWLLADPRTEVSPDFLTISTTIDRGDYLVELEIATPLTKDDKQLLKAIGKIVSQPLNMESLVC